MVSKKSSKKSKQPQGDPSLLEWISGGIGALLAIAVLSLLTIEALDSTTARPPLLLVEPVGAVKAGEMYVVEVEVANRSGQTAAAVEIEGELSSGGEPVETSGATVAYVPAHSKRSAGLVFTRDPRTHQLQIRATGYEEP